MTDKPQAEGVGGRAPMHERLVDRDALTGHLAGECLLDDVGSVAAEDVDIGEQEGHAEQGDGTAARSTGDKASQSRGSSRWVATGSGAGWGDVLSHG